MEHQTFWAVLFDENRQKKYEDRVHELARQSVKDIFDFAAIRDHYFMMVYNNPSVAQCLQNDGFRFSDDSYVDFIGWLMLQGEKNFFDYLNQPSTIRQMVPQGDKLPMNWDVFGMPDDAYTRKRNLILNKEEEFLDDDNRLVLLFEEDFYRAKEKLV